MALAKTLARRKPKGGKLSLRAVAAEMAAQALDLSMKYTPLQAQIDRLPLQ